MVVVEVSKEQFDSLIAQVNQEKLDRAKRMPTDRDAIKVMFDAWQRLKELGWNDPCYCPKDGSVFEVIEAGSTGIFDCHYEGEWPTGRWWIYDGEDVWPSRPTMYRRKTVLPVPAEATGEGGSDAG